MIEPQLLPCVRARCRKFHVHAVYFHFAFVAPSKLEVYLDPSGTSEMDYFRRKIPSQLDRVLDISLLNISLQLTESLRRSFEPLRLDKGILDSRSFLTALINHRKQKYEILDSPHVLISLSNIRNKKTKYMVLFHLFFLSCTITRPKFRVLIDLFRLFAHTQSTKIYDPFSHILSFVRPFDRNI